MKKFNELGISENIMRAIDEMGIENATLVQEKTVPTLKNGKDVIILSSTGSGKTIAFGIPALESIDPAIRKPQVLIICPTRELAMQVNGEIKKLCKYLPGVNSFAVFGGQPIGKQIRDLKSKPNVIVGTPGRLIDHIERKTLRLESVHMLILDEADEMLKMGFKEDIDKINAKIGKRQGVLASATMSKEIKILTKKFLTDPETIDAGNANSPAKNIHQEYITVSSKGKKKLLLKMLEDLDGTALIFSNTKRMTTALYSMLNENGVQAKEIHGDMRQNERTRAMNAFKNGKVNVLVATDVAARGIDVNNITCVINYDYPAMEEYYIHRIGRTGRANNKGTAYTFLTNGNDLKSLTSLSKKLDFEVHNSELSNDIKMTVTATSPSSRGRFNQRGRSNSSRTNSSNRNSSSSYGRNSSSSYGRNSSSSKSSYGLKEDSNSERAPRSPRRDRDNDRTPRRDSERNYGKSRDSKSYSKRSNSEDRPYSKKRPDGSYKKSNDRTEKTTDHKRTNVKNKGRKTSNSKTYGEATSPKDFFGKTNNSKSKTKSSYSKKPNFKRTTNK